MTFDEWMLLLGGGSVGVAGIGVVLKRYGRAMVSGLTTASSAWLAGKAAYEQSTKVETDGLTMESTVRTNDPQDLVQNPTAHDTVLSTVLEQLNQVRTHSKWQDERLDAVEARLEDRDRRIKELETELSQLRAENKTLHGENAALRSRINELEQELSRLRQA